MFYDFSKIMQNLLGVLQDYVKVQMAQDRGAQIIIVEELRQDDRLPIIFLRPLIFSAL